MPVPKRKRASVVVYDDSKKKSRWRVRSNWNGKKISAATEGYNTKRALSEGMVISALALLQYLRANDNEAYQEVMNRNAEDD